MFQPKRWPKPVKATSRSWYDVGLSTVVVRIINTPPLEKSHFLPRLYHLFRAPVMQSSQEAQSPSSGCKATRRSSIRPRSVLPRMLSVPRSGNRWPLALTRVIGPLGLATSRATARSRHCTTTWGRNCWTTGLRDSMRVFWLVSPLPPC